MLNYKLCAFADEIDADFDKQISGMKQNGIEYLELRSVYGKNVSLFTEAEAKDYRRKLDSNGIKVWSVGSPIGKIKITDDFTPELERFKHTLEIGQILGAKAFRMFSFYIEEGENPEVYKDEVFERLQKFVDVSKDSGMVLCHENEKKIYGDTPERCLKIHKTFPVIKAVFDPANFVQCGVETLRAYDTLKNYIEYMHIKDSLPDCRIVSAGDGVGNVIEISKAFLKSGGEMLTLEPHLYEFVGLKDLERENGKSEVGSLNFETALSAFNYAVQTFVSKLEG